MANGKRRVMQFMPILARITQEEAALMTIRCQKCGVVKPAGTVPPPGWLWEPQPLHGWSHECERDVRMTDVELLDRLDVTSEVEVWRNRNGGWSVTVNGMTGTLGEGKTFREAAIASIEKAAEGK